MGTNSPPPPPQPQPPVQVQEVPRPSSEPTTLKPDSSPTNPTTTIPTPTIIPTIASNDSKETPGGFRGTTFMNVRLGSSRSSSMGGRLRRTLGFTSTTGTLLLGGSEKTPRGKSPSRRPGRLSSETLDLFAGSLISWRLGV
ncbi:hypothetical protein CsSME_00036490 [Camellia sinensis var. sinensis]